MRRLVFPLLAAAVFVAPNAPLGAEESARWLSSSAHGSAVRLLTNSQETVVQSGGRNTLLPAMADAHLESVSTTENGWIVVGTEAREEGRELVLIAEIDGEMTNLPVPAGRNDSIRDNPIVLTEGGQLAGMLWLQGADSSSYRIEYADWDGSRWRRRGRLTGRGPGSQLALDAVVLDDGSWLAVWSRYDRNDDEIYWSRRQNGEWSTPSRVSADNDVPDIVPSITAIGGEALLAWSRFEAGDYRLRTARFSQGLWVEEQVVGVAGSAFPSWHQAPSGVALVYRQALPSSWVWMDFDLVGRAQRYSVVAGGPEERPLPTFEGGEAQFLFPSGHREAANWSTPQ